MSRIVSVVLLGCLVASPALAGKKDKKKKGAEEPPPVGWHQEEGWAGSCWHPPAFEDLGVGDRRLAWQQTRDEMMKQWNGAMSDGVQMKEKYVVDFETVLLAKPERIEAVSRENLAQCKAFMTGKQSATDWEAWLLSQPGKLTEGECPNPPLDYTLFDYLNIAHDWQIPAYVCKDDHIKVKGTEADYYRISPDGPWINVEGDPEQPAPAGLPCNIEGCYRGQLIMRFTGESGIQTIHAVGTYFEFLAPEHGKVEVMINDDTMSDNLFKVESGLEHHTGIEYSPRK